MKLYYHPASTTSRPVLLFAAEQKIPFELQVVDLFTGEHYQPPYEAINPNHLVPVLEDGDFRLTESSAILKYLADQSEQQKASSPAGLLASMIERCRAPLRSGAILARSIRRGCGCGPYDIADKAERPYGD